MWRVLGQAIAFIDNKVKRHDPCNAYFRKLRRGKSLREVVESESVYLHRIEPLAGFTEDDLPRGISVGAHVGLPLYMLAEFQPRRRHGIADPRTRPRRGGAEVQGGPDVPPG